MPSPTSEAVPEGYSRQMIAAAIGFLLLVVGGYYMGTWANLTRLQITTLQITTGLSVAGLIASVLSVTLTTLIELTLTRIVLFAGIVAAGIGSYATFPAAQHARGEIGSEQKLVPGAINCDCDNTGAPNIGGAATRQCRASENRLTQAVSAGGLQLVIQDGKIASANMALCDSVTAGPAAWPKIGAPTKSPYHGGGNGGGGR